MFSTGMRISIISTGDELLAGSIADTNAAWVAARLRELGHRAVRISAVGDDVEEIAAVLRRELAENDLLVVGGGLGPTLDDLTARAAAAAVGAPTVRSAEAEAQVRAAFARLGREMDPINLRQAELPEGCRILVNRQGTAPGFTLERAGCTAFFLPGVPAELRPMFDEHVAPALPRPATREEPIVLRCFGAGESGLQAALKPLIDRHPGLREAFRVTYPEVGVTLSGFPPGEREDVRREALDLVGHAVFAEGSVDLPTALGRALAEAGLTLGCAESCTGGLIGHAMTSVSGSSAWFRGGVVAYSNDLKTSLLGVPAATIERHGAVSEETVRAMAEGARERLGCDLALATSGIAGPGGGSPEKPVGLVHIALAHPGGIVHKRRVFGGLERGRVKRAAAWDAMMTARRLFPGPGRRGVPEP
jgi:nicotinamide-nucleotide amidase